jgi:hypothetical protein
VHLLVEANINQVLTTGKRSLLISFTKKLNLYWKELGPVIKERYHLHVLKTIKETQNPLKYVLQNYLKHKATYQSEFSAVLFKSEAWLLKRATG